MHSLPDATFRASCVERAVGTGRCSACTPCLRVAAANAGLARSPNDGQTNVTRGSRRPNRSPVRASTTAGGLRRCVDAVAPRRAAAGGAGCASRRKLSMMSRNASMRVSRPASAVCESISRTRYGLRPIIQRR